MKANKIKVQKADNGFILRFENLDRKSPFEEEYDYDPNKLEVYSDEKQLFERIAKLFLKDERIK